MHTQTILVVILSVYIVCLLFIFLFSITQGYLAYAYVKLSKKAEKDIPASPDEWPLVTVQLPIYNELYVVERLIDSVAQLDYPTNRLEIQVLDDSDDESIDVAIERVRYWQQQGIDIQHITREDRVGYKAGALKYGLQIAKGEYVAIFDADFVPTKQFLKQSIPVFTSDEIGMVQTRWEHLNRNQSLLTRAQAFALDAHFRVEQAGRNGSGFFINFNGTAGVWRKECIEDAGNWQADTLTEDLDLSYRAQIKGWRFVYVEDISVPAELPPVMSAVKSQQYRWNKGGAETSIKLLPKLLTAKLPFKIKWYGCFHLINSAVFIAVFVSAFCSIPLLYFKKSFPEFRILFAWLSIFLISFFVISWIYYIVFKRYYTEEKSVWKKYLKEFPVYLSFSMGMSLHNAWAVAQGYSGKKTAFIRTPKFNINLTKNLYEKHAIKPIAIIELLLTFYFSYGIYFAVVNHDISMLPFHMMLTFGFGIVSYYTLFHGRRKNTTTING